MSIVTVTNQKGGVGKTTTSVNLAHGLALAGKRVLLVDFDPQGHDAISLGFDPEPGVFDWLVAGRPLANLVRETGRKNLFLLPGNGRTRTAQTVLRDELAGLSDIAGQIKKLAEGYDHVVIDTHNGGLLQEAALAAADTLIVPVLCELLALDGVAATMQIVGMVNADTQIIIVPTAFDARLNNHEYHYGLLANAYPGMVVSPIPARTAVSAAMADGLTVYESKDRGARDVARAYNQVIRWVVASAEDVLFGEVKA